MSEDSTEYRTTAPLAWKRSGELLYLTEPAGRSPKGEPYFRHRLEVAVGGYYETPAAETEALAARLFDFLSAAPLATGVGEGRLLSAERLAAMERLLVLRRNHVPTWPHFFGPIALKDEDLSDLLVHAAALTTQLQEAEAAKQLLVQETHRWSEAEKRDKARHQAELDKLSARLTEELATGAESERQKLELVKELAAANPFFPADDWHDEDGDVLWWRFPIDEPPYVGSPRDTNWHENGYGEHYTHFQKFDYRGYDDEKAQIKPAPPHQEEGEKEVARG